MEILVGCCGQAGLRLKDYGSNFPAMEIQSTFYRLPKLETAVSWRAQAPSLKFSIKAFQAVTHPTTSPTWKRARSQRPVKELETYGHLQPSQNVLRAWEATLEICRVINADACLIQLPPSFDLRKGHIDNIARFFSQIKREGIIAIEFRHDSWFSNEKELSKFLRDLQLTHVVDPLHGKPAYIEKTGYYRLHGRRLSRGRLDYRYKYSDEEIRTIKRRVMEFGGETGYVFFNNFSMRDDASRLQALL